MPSTTKSVVLTGVRVLFVVAGVGITTLIVLKLASMPPPPPNTDGFAHGMAAIIGGILIILSLGLAALGVILPSLLGRHDKLGFNRWQRLALKGAGGLIGGGILLGLAVGLVIGLGNGFFLWLSLVGIAVIVVLLTLGWRLAETIITVLSRVVGDEMS